MRTPRSGSGIGTPDHRNPFREPPLRGRAYPRVVAKEQIYLRVPRPAIQRPEPIGVLRAERFRFGSSNKSSNVPVRISARVPDPSTRRSLLSPAPETNLKAYCPQLF